MSRRWATGAPRSRITRPVGNPAPLETPEPSEILETPESSETLETPEIPAPGHARSGSAGPAVGAASAGPAVGSGSVTPGEAGQGPLTRLGALAERAGAICEEWAPTAGRILLGTVFAWFGYHELLHPGQWTQYVPAVNESSSLAVFLVLVHGWVLFVMAAALVAGIAPRPAAAIASVLMLEIVISLAVTGLSDTALRDVGVLGLAVCLTGCKNQRLVLRG